MWSWLATQKSKTSKVFPKQNDTNIKPLNR